MHMIRWFVGEGEYQMKLADTLVQSMFDERGWLINEGYDALLEALETAESLEAEYLQSQGFDAAAEAVQLGATVMRFDDGSVVVNDEDCDPGTWSPFDSVETAVANDTRLQRVELEPDAPEPCGAWAARYMDDTEDLDGPSVSWGPRGAHERSETFGDV